ncbi:MAG TPA: NAD(P)-dependent oxidoreductase [Chryseolinea sp.]|nr:NAD(P)-dependent oxidoreductase [Chryseolinea sp.]HPH46889.1 NAD(P)-dependent oxidoreductase [Chryseolinea sp.]HPM30004.1 NAD(P)-dependent oxidoreductase [Chryseolinea sp.]
MKTAKIGLMREGKTPPDKRVPFSPKQVEEMLQRFPNLSVVSQQSTTRCFKDEEYTELDIPIVAELNDCDIIMGIKEVPLANLIEKKTYLFFSHTIKKQPYNKKLLQEIIRKKITLIDYEVLRDVHGNRLVAFGRFAGIVGAYNGLWTYGMRYKNFMLRRAHECFDVNDLKLELRKVNLPAIKIILTGAGRVGKGSMETLDSAGVRKVSPHDFLTRQFNEPVYVQLSSADYHMRKEGGHFNREEFHQHPERYYSIFHTFSKVADVLLAGAYWNPKAPVLFTREEMQSPDFKIKIIADITCDIEGSIPSTKRASSIADPIYDYDPVTDSVQLALDNPKCVTVMAVDNLPCELPRSASEEFGRDLIDRILPCLFIDDPEKIIERGTIASNGKLTSHFEYLSDYIA